MPTPYAGSDTFPTSYNIPSDGDRRNASSINVGLEALGDRTKWLKNRLGKWRVVEIAEVAVDSADESAPTTYDTFTSETYVASTTGVVSLATAAAVDDVVLVEAYVVGISSGDAGWIRVVTKQGSAGATTLPGAQAVVPIGTTLPVSLRGMVVVSTAGTFTADIRGRVQMDGGPTLTFGIAMLVRLTLLRPN